MMATYGMFKLVLMGDLGVGKTCIHHRIVGEDAPNNSTISKIGTFFNRRRKLKFPPKQFTDRLISCNFLVSLAM